MRRLLHARRSGVTVIAVAAAVVSAAGISYAATGGFAGAHTARASRIYACVTARFSTLNLTTAGAVCPSGEQKISWNAEGPRGARGPRGLNGRAGRRGLMGATGPQGLQGPQG